MPAPGWALLLLCRFCALLCSSGDGPEQPGSRLLSLPSMNLLHHSGPRLRSRHDGAAPGPPHRAGPAARTSRGAASHRHVSSYTPVCSASTLHSPPKPPGWRLLPAAALPPSAWHVRVALLLCAAVAGGRLPAAQATYHAVCLAPQDSGGGPEVWQMQPGRNQPPSLANSARPARLRRTSRCWGPSTDPRLPTCWCRCALPWAGDAPSDRQSLASAASGIALQGVLVPGMLFPAWISVAALVFGAVRYCQPACRTSEGIRAAGHGAVQLVHSGPRSAWGSRRGDRRPGGARHPQRR